MKKWLLHYIYISVLGVLAASCSNYLDEDTPSSTATDKINVTFTLAMNATSSRAATTDETGSSYDNRIDADGLQVLFYNADGNECLGKVENIKVFRSTESENIYQFMGNLTIENTGDYTLASCKVMVFANTKTEVNARTNPAELTFDYEAEGFRNETVNIPMWGVASFTDLRLAPGTNTDLGIIYLLRATAKTEVILSENSASKYKLAKVHINRYYKKGFCLPNGYANLANTQDITDGNAYNPYTVGQTIANGADFLKKDGDNYIFYMAEYNNEDTEMPKIEIEITDGENKPITLKDPTIYFKDYATDTPFNVVRNFHYIFSVTIKEDQSGNIKTDILSEIEPWGVSDVSSDYE